MGQTVPAYENSDAKSYLLGQTAVATEFEELAYSMRQNSELNDAQMSETRRCRFC